MKRLSLLLVVMLLATSADTQQRVVEVWPGGEQRFAVQGTDTFRLKMWNSWPQADAGQVVTTNPHCAVAGPENTQLKAVIKFRRRRAPETKLTVTKIVTTDNDRGAAGIASAGILAIPFGATAAKGRTVTDADATFNTKTINAISIANPTQITTSVAHTLTTGDLIVITGSNSTPSADGLWYVINASGSTFNIALNVTGSGTAGTLNTSRTLTSATAAFTALDVGKTITVSTGGTLCPGTGDWGTGGPYTTQYSCQGPKFPSAPGVYQGTIVAFTSSTTVTVKPSFTVDPAGTGTLKIEPVLLADDDGLELGDGWITGVDLNYWQMGASTCTLKRGQWFIEAEINRGPFNMHEGETLIKQYIEVSGHLSWPGGNIASGKVDGRGWNRMVVVTQPSAGADFTVTVPTKAHWRLISVRAQLATSATAATRIPSFIIDDGAANIPWVVPLAAFPTASQTHQFLINPSAGHLAQTYPSGAIIQSLGLPEDYHMQAGWRFRTSTSSIQAGDQWSAIVLQVEEWIEE